MDHFGQIIHLAWLSSFHPIRAHIRSKHSKQSTGNTFRMARPKGPMLSKNYNQHRAKIPHRQLSSNLNPPNFLSSGLQGSSMRSVQSIDRIIWVNLHEGSSALINVQVQLSLPHIRRWEYLRLTGASQLAWMQHLLSLIHYGSKNGLPDEITRQARADNRIVPGCVSCLLVAGHTKFF